MRNGKNDEHLKERLNKMKNAVRAIITCCRQKIMERVGTRIALQLHEAVTIPSLLYNAETWTLNKMEPVAQRQEMVSGTLALLGDLSAVVFEVSRASAPKGDEVL